MAGAAGTIASYPFDLLRTTMAAQGEPKVSGLGRGDQVMVAAFSLLNAQSEGQAVGGGDQSNSVAQWEYVRGRKQGGHWCSARGTHGRL